LGSLLPERARLHFTATLAITTFVGFAPPAI
jgi:hypothetical protein